MYREKVVEIISARYTFGHFFPELLKRLLQKVPSGSIKKALKANLKEELGKSITYLGPHHKEGRKKLLEALGLNYCEWEPKGDLNNLDEALHPAAKKVILDFRELIDHPNYLVGVGAICASEGLVVNHYSWLVELLEQYCPEITDEDMNHLLDHIDHDVHHSDDLEELLLLELDQDLVLFGEDQATKAWATFLQYFLSTKRLTN